MKIVLNQNQVGRFNLLGNESSLAFSMTIIDGDEGKIVERDGVKCVARIRTDEDPEYKSEELGELFDQGAFDEIAQQCLAGGRDVPETKAFIATYIENFPELRSVFETSKKQKLEKQIAQLQAELKGVRMPPGYYEMAELIKGLADAQRDKATTYRKWQQDYKESSEQYVKYENYALECEQNASTLLAEYEALYKRCDELFEAFTEGNDLALTGPEATPEALKSAQRKD